MIFDLFIGEFRLTSIENCNYTGEQLCEQENFGKNQKG